MYLESADRKRAGWTDTSIRRFLRPSAIETRRSHRFGYYDVHLYDAEAVMIAVQSDAARKFFDRSHRTKLARAQVRQLDVLDATR